MTDTVDVGTHHEHHLPIDLNQPLVLEVHNPNGAVTVRAADRGDVLVSHVVHGFPSELGDETALTIDARENRIEVRPQPHLGFGWGGVSADIDLEAVVGQVTKAFRWGGPWSPGKLGKMRLPFGRHAWIDITIDVPRTVTGRFGVHAASGNVQIEGVTGEIALNAMSGDVRVLRTSGDLTLQTASGDSLIEGATGRLTAQTASGDIRVISAQIDGFQIQSASGDLQLDALLTGDGPCRARTASGDVRLTLRRPTAGGEEPAATLAFQTVSGDAHVTPPFRQTGRRLWQAGAGERGPRIEVATVSGDLSAGIAAVESAFAPTPAPASPADDVPPAPSVPPAPTVLAPPPSPAEPAPPAVSWPRGEAEPAAADAGPESAPSTAQDDAARLAVLAAVERGEIDVEEALRRLDAADAITSP